MMLFSKNRRFCSRQRRKNSHNYTASMLYESINSTIRQYYRKGKTTVSYANHIKLAKKWLHDAVTAGHVDSSMADGFTVLSDRTAEALLLYTAHKCSSEGQSLSYSTAEGIRYAFREYWIKYVAHSRISSTHPDVQILPCPISAGNSVRSVPAVTRRGTSMPLRICGLGIRSTSRSIAATASL